MISTIKNHAKENATAFRVYLDVSGLCWGIQGSQMLYSMFLGMGKLDL